MGNAGFVSMYDHINPVLIIVNEGPRPTKVQPRPLFVFYEPCAIPIFGDNNQLQPVMKSKLKENGFFSRLCLSFFARLTLLGHPSIAFNE